MAKKILIFGGCVSKDAFNLPEVNCKFDLVGYYACPSLASIGLLPIDFDSQLLSNIKSNFQREMFEHDMVKQFLIDVVSVDFDLLLINLIDDRFNLLDISTDHIIKNSNEYSSYCNDFTNDRIIKHDCDEYLRLWRKGLNELVNILCKYNLIHKVRIIQVYWSSSIKNKYTNELNQRNNAFLFERYKDLRRFFPNESFVLFGKSLFQSDVINSCGVATFFYSYDFCRAMFHTLSNSFIQIKLDLDSINKQLKVNLQPCCDDSIEVAYYLFVDGIKRDVIWYQANNFVSFDVAAYSGVLQVHGFVKTKHYDCKMIYISAQLDIQNKMSKYDLHQWKRKIYSYSSYDEFLEIDNLNDGIHSIGLTKNINLDILVSCLKYMRSGSNYRSRCLVVFGGAITARNTKFAPFFSGVNLSNDVKLPLISISDPALMMDDHIQIGWYLGSEKVPDLIGVISKILNHISKILLVDFIVVGGSAGGFAALSLATVLPHTHYIVFNPQVNIVNYYLRFVNELVNVCFPISKSRSMIALSNGEIPTKKVFDRLFADIGLKYDLSRHEICESNRLIYLQNDSDDVHVNYHANIYIKNMGLNKVSSSIFECENIMLYFCNWGTGHAPIPPKYLVELIEQIKERKLLNDIVCGLVIK